MKKRAAGIVALSMGAIVVTVWALRQRDQSAGAPETSEAANTTASLNRAASDSTHPAFTPLPTVPGTYPKEVSQEVGALVDQLEHHGLTQDALIAQGPSIVPQLLAALRAIAAQQNSRPPLSEEDMTRLERRKLQLYFVLGELASREAAPTLIEVALLSRPDSYAFLRASDALDAIGASGEADQFVIDLAGRPDASMAMLMAAFYRFDFRPAPPAVIAAAERWLDPTADYRLRNLALRVMATSGQQAKALAAYEAAVGNSQNNLDYRALSALAETLPPDQFARLIERPSLSESMRNDVMVHSRYAWADPAERTRLAREMVAKSRPLEANAIGIKHLLETGQADLLLQLGVVRMLPSADGTQTLHVSHIQQIIIAHLGYRLREAGNGVAIEKFDFSRP